MKSINKNITNKESDYSIYEKIAYIKSQKDINEYTLCYNIITKMSYQLTNESYDKNINQKRKTIKNGLNIIHNVPFVNEDLSEETKNILEWIYKEMYIKSKREVDYIKMKKIYDKKIQKNLVIEIDENKIFTL